MKSPIKYVGGKSRLAADLLRLYPEHHAYVEVFGGGGVMLLSKPPSRVEVYNDVDEALVGFFRVLRDEESFDRFYHLAMATPYSRQEYHHCLDHWRDYEDPVERAWAWFVVARMSFGGQFGAGFGTSKVEPEALSFTRAVDRLPEIHARLRPVLIEHLDWRQIIPKYDSSDTFFYLDPPYIRETCKEGSGYAHEMSVHDHVALVRLVQQLKGKVLLSGYPHPCYQPLVEAGWRTRSFKRQCYMLGGANMHENSTTRTETVWANYPIVSVSPSGLKNDPFAPLRKASRK